MLNLTVQNLMTPLPQTIEHDQSLAAAHSLMRTHDIRHLPVVKDGRLAGIVSQRDLYLIETLADVDMTEAPVSDAMTTDLYTVEPSTSILEISQAMFAHRYGSALVMEGHTVVGIFTTTDALATLYGVVDTLAQEQRASKSRAQIVR